MPAWLQAADGAALLWIQNTLRGPVPDAVLGLYTVLGNSGLLFLALCLALLWRRDTRRAGVLGLCAMAAGFLCTNLALKPLFARPRPWVALPQIIPLVVELDPNSFPSGHATAAFAAACAWRCALPRWWMRAAGLGLAALMALSRLYAGVHYPSDVLAGALIGAAAGFLCCHMARRYEEWKEKRTPPASDGGKSNGSNKKLK